MNRIKLIFTSIGIGVVGVLSLIIKSLRTKNESLKNEKQAIKAELQNEKLAREVENELNKEVKDIHSMSHEEIQDKWRSGK